MENCTQVIDISDIGFDISDLGRVKLATLIVNGTSYDIYKGENVIGRDECSDILLRNDSISNKHAVVEVEDWDTHMIYDSGSTNKTRLGKMFLKPNVRYHLQGGEDIFFADLKAKYIKLDKPEIVDTNEESVSNAGSESLLNSVPVDLEHDLDDLENDHPSPVSQAQKNQEEDNSHGSNKFSILNDSSLMEENKQKPSASKLQIVEASDDSTDDEVDFIPPSQTVKEFASKNNSMPKKLSSKSSVTDIFPNGNSFLNTQQEEMIFLDVGSNNLISNSLNSQRFFSSEAQGPSVPKTGVVCDPRVFEAETQDFESEKNNQYHYKCRVSSDIFDAETEVSDINVSSDGVMMSNLELSNTSSLSVLPSQKTNEINVNTVEEKKSPEKSSKENVSLFQLENKQLSETKAKVEFCDFNCTNKSEVNIAESKHNVITEVKEEKIYSNSVKNINEQNHFSFQVENYAENSLDPCDIMTQPNKLLNLLPSCKSDRYGSEYDERDMCTQVNTSLKKEPGVDLIVKREISFEEEQRDVSNFSAEETQINFNIKDRNITNISKRVSRSEKISIEGDETQPNIFLHSFFSKSGSVKGKNAKLSDSSAKASDSVDSDDTDIEDDRNTQPNKNITNTTEGQCYTGQKLVQSSSPKTKSYHGFNESSNESDSVLASVLLDADLLEKKVLSEIPKNSTRDGNNENCENFKQEEILFNEDLKKNEEITVGDMDICSTVGNGTYLSVCTSSNKVKNTSKGVNNLQSSSKQTTLVTTCASKSKVKETETFNHSIMFNEPCGSSTPFRSEEGTKENNVKNIETLAVTTPPRNIVEEVNSPDLPCTDELVEVACKTPERQCITRVSDSNKKKEDLPLALKRTPRVKKLSRKVVEALELHDKIKVCEETNLTNLVINCKQKVEEPIDVKANCEKKKTHVKRKLVGQQKKPSEADNDKSPNISNDELLKENYCVKRLSVSLTDIKTVKDKERETDESDIEGQSTAKRTKNVDVSRKNSDHAKEEQSGLERESLLDKRQSKHVDNLELNGAEKKRKHNKVIKDVDSKSIEIPASSNGEKSGVKTSAEKGNQKSAKRHVDDDAGKCILQNTSDLNSDINSYSDHSSLEKNRVNRKIRNDKNEVSSSQMPSKCKSSLSVNTRKSSRRKNEDVCYPASEEKEICKRKSQNSDDPHKTKLSKLTECARENIEKAKDRKNARISCQNEEVNCIETNCTSLVMNASEPRKEIKSKESDLEKTEAKKARGRPRKKKADVDLNFGKEIIECESKTLNETGSSTSQNSKKRSVLMNESIENEPLDKKSNSIGNLKKNSKVIDNSTEVVPRHRHPTRSRNIPARFREMDHGSDSSCSGSDKGPLPNKRRKESNDSSCVDAAKLASNSENKTKSNKEHSLSISNSSSTKKHSELFKTPDENRSRSKTEVNKESRSRSRGDSSRSSLQCNTSSTNSNNTKKLNEPFKTPIVENQRRSETEVNKKSRSRSRSSNSSQSSLRSNTSLIQSPRRQGNKGKCVLFTSGLINPTWESQVKKLGGKVVDCPVECSILVADKVRRTVKFLCVLGQGKPIVSPEWLIQSWRCTNFVDPFDQLLVDKEAEDKFRFSLSQTLQAAKNQPLLRGYYIHATPSVRPLPEDIKSITVCCGGEYIEKVPSKWPENSVIISDPDDKALWKKLKVNGQSPPIVAAEMLLIGVLQHKLEIKPHRISSTP